MLMPCHMCSQAYLPQTMAPNPPSATRASTRPAGMSLVPRIANYAFETAGVEIECGPGDQYGCDVQFAWEDHPMQEHKKSLAVPAYYIDTTPVTCGEYAEYLQASKYSPAASLPPRSLHNWLKNWGSGRVESTASNAATATNSSSSDGIVNAPKGAARTTVADSSTRKRAYDRLLAATPAVPLALVDVPVTYVSYREAAEYCRFNNKRLPDTWEWQLAAQGTTGYAYPWGNADKPSCRPELSSNRTLPGAERVDAYKCGASPYNVLDMVGNVWQMTSAFTDARTRSVILKGGSNYR